MEVSKKDLCLKNGKVVLEKEIIKKDILIKNGRIAAIENIINADCEEINCDDRIILPCLCDLHCHLREPGYEYKETIESGAQAALFSGFSTIVMMPNTNPAIDNAELVKKIKDKISKLNLPIEIIICGAISKNRESKELSEIEEMVKAGIKMISDDGSSVKNAGILREAMELAKRNNLIISSHCEDNDLTNKGVFNEGKISQKYKIKGMPAIAEEIIIERDLRLAEFTNCKIHIQHLSTAEGLNIIKRFKEKNVKVSCEVTPHHLIFSEDDIEENNLSNYKMNPPLRRKEDCEKLIEGIIDCIATDHAPHSEEEKKVNIEKAPFGIIGFETALISLYHYLIKNKKISWNDLVRVFTNNPRKLLNLESINIAVKNKANLIVFNPDGQTKFNKEYFKSKSKNTPLLNKTLDGEIEKIIIENKIINKEKSGEICKNKNVK